MTAKRLLIRKSRIIIDQGARTKRILRTGMNAAISLVELRMTSQLKGKPGKPKEQPNKAGVLGEKWTLNFLNYY